MKLNYKRTITAGLAFMAIMAFWQLYDGVVPLMLKETFDIPDTIAGVIMALDNVVAFFLLPVLGGISDRCKSPLGKRKPFIIAGTAVSVVLMQLLPIFDNAYSAAPSKRVLAGFFTVIALLLITMAFYRTPAVALMPDITPPQLRSKGNAIVNVMGALGIVFYLGLSTFMYSKDRTAGLAHVDYLPIFIVTGVLMVICVAIMSVTVHERRFAEEAQAEAKKQDADGAGSDKKIGVVAGLKALPAPVRRSMIFMLSSIALWYMGYNAMSTSFTKYAARVWGMSLGQSSFCLITGTIAAFLFFIPSGELSMHFGRRKMVLIGLGVLSACFGAAVVLTFACDGFSPLFYVVFMLIGAAWACINVNSLPMVVEMCDVSQIGQFTGYYYTFSMGAQIATPIISGALLEYVGYRSLFPYGLAFCLLAICTMLGVKHGETEIIGHGDKQ